VSVLNGSGGNTSCLEGTSRWLETARIVTSDRLAALLEEFRPYLRSIAEVELPERFSARLDASDIVQETLLRAFRQFSQFAGQTDAEFVGWLRRILLNQIIDTVRHHGRRMRDASRDVAVSHELPCGKTVAANEPVLYEEAGDRLRLAMESLPANYREVLTLRHVENLTFGEIGERLGRSSDAVRMLWGRAAILLGKRMRPDG
jgi:RNA polymerase sigma-70 factor, ECF subfamily